MTTVRKGALVEWKICLLNFQQFTRTSSLISLCTVHRHIESVLFAHTHLGWCSAVGIAQITIVIFSARFFVGSWRRQLASEAYVRSRVLPRPPRSPLNEGGFANIISPAKARNVRSHHRAKKLSAWPALFARRAANNVERRSAANSAADASTRSSLTDCNLSSSLNTWFIACAAFCSYRPLPISQTSEEATGLLRGYTGCRRASATQ